VPTVPTDERSVDASLFFGVGDQPGELFHDDQIAAVLASEVDDSASAFLDSIIAHVVDVRLEFDARLLSADRLNRSQAGNLRIRHTACA
jgi:hypothetical protein